MTEVDEACIRKIAEVKGVSVQSITLDSTLESLAIDSLDLVTLSFELEEQYGVEIPETKLRQVQTVRDVSLAIQQVMSKKQEATDGGAGAV